jgi:hypothetical protein
MNCKKTRNLLHLHREGELSERQVESLKRHLEDCPDCAAELERISRLEETVRRARENAPKPANPEALTGRIMNAIAGPIGDSSLHPAAQNDGRNPIRRMEGFNRPALSRLFGAGRIRFSLAAAAFAIVGTFFIQESMILSRISRLEGRMAVISTSQTSPASLRNALQPAEGIDGIPKITLTQSALQEEWVRIRKTDLDRLLRIVQKQYPGIRTLDEALSVDQDTMLRILRNNSGIVRQLLQSS